MKKITAVALCILLALTVFAGCSGKSATSEPASGSAEAPAAEVAATTGEFEKTIYFGLNYELTGANPIIGESSVKGIDMAVNEINAAGGITVNGETYGLAYKALDNGFNTDEAAVNAQQFADDSEIVAMIGPNDSDMCITQTTQARDMGYARGARRTNRKSSAWN